MQSGSTHSCKQMPMTGLTGLLSWECIFLALPSLLPPNLRARLISFSSTINYDLNQMYNLMRIIRTQHYQSIIQFKSSEKMDQPTTNFIYFLAVIGGIVFIVFTAKILWSLIKGILPSKNFKDRYGEGSWAVVTGGSDGIGLGFCQQLAKLGFNICIIARNKQKMEDVLQRIKQENHHMDLQTKAVVADFSQCRKDNFFDRISRELEGMNIALLINNVGISNIGILHEIPQKRILQQIEINVVVMTMMCWRLIPSMLKRQRRAGIINVSSFAGQHPIPYVATYSATKAYNDFFSQAIQMEYSHKIDVLSLRPLLVESNMSKQKKSCSVASRNECAAAALKYLGVDYKSNGYWVHRLMAWVTGCLPQTIIRCLSQSNSRQIMENQKKGQKI